MSTVLAWKDLDYRDSLSAEQLAELPAHPAGDLLDEAQLTQLSGGTTTAVDCFVTSVLIGASLSFCTHNTVCGTCGVWSSGCC